MKGAVLAGGLGTRLYPLTYATSKHLLPVWDRPMVFYPIQTLVKAGIREVIVVTGGPHAGHYIQVLRNGKHLGLEHLEYAFQEKEGGIAQALALCEDFADRGPLAVILGDNCTDANIKGAIQTFKRGATVFLKEVDDPGRFGVPVFEKIKNIRPSDEILKNFQKSKIKNNEQEIRPQTHKIVKIEEKPKKPKSNFAVTGLYIYDKNVFQHIKQCKPSKRGELEITDVNNFYIKKNQLNWQELEGFWSDAGTFESLYRTNQFWAEKSLKGKVQKLKDKRPL
jgi:glucose-1-phosphate thymidylyltransferase